MVDLSAGIRWGNDLDANLRCMGEEEGILENFRPMGSQPCDIDGLYAACRRNRAFCNSESLRKEIGEERGDGRLAASVTKGRRGTHKDVAKMIGLNTIVEFRKFRVSQDLGPASHVERGLRLKVRKLDRRGHIANIGQK